MVIQWPLLYGWFWGCYQISCAMWWFIYPVQRSFGSFLTIDGDNFLTIRLVKSYGLAMLYKFLMYGILWYWFTHRFIIQCLHSSMAVFIYWTPTQYTEYLYMYNYIYSLYIIYVFIVTVHIFLEAYPLTPFQDGQFYWCFQEEPLANQTDWGDLHRCQPHSRGTTNSFSRGNGFVFSPHLSRKKQKSKVVFCKGNAESFLFLFSFFAVVWGKVLWCHVMQCN